MTAPSKSKVLIAFIACACGSVSESDPEFWEKSADLGGKKFDLGATSGGPGGVPGTGGIVTDPNASGGSVAAGGAVPSGGGGTSSGGFTPGSGGVGPLGGSGGFVSTGGVSTTGGVTSSSGGVTGTGGVTVGPAGPCKFTFSVTTVTARGRYAPANVGAIWISDAQGKLVKALEVWGLRRLSNATAWQTASAGARVDVVTAATKQNHGTHNVTWDCLDPSKNPVPTGTYQAHVTFAESDAFPFFGPAPIQASMNFERTGAPVQASGTNTANFTSMRVTIE